MFKKDIELAFTVKVSEYLKKGYVFNVSSMGGSQGEIASVDLRKDDEIVRIVLESKYSTFDLKYISLTVGRNTDRQAAGWDSTVWTRHLDVIEEIKFFEVRYNSGYYVAEDVAREAAELREKRRKMKAVKNGKFYVFPEEAKMVVLPFMRRQKDCKSIRVSQISGVTRGIRNGKTVYSVIAKGNIYRMH